jgi:hypothetical protein
MAIELEVKEALKIDEGKHEGTITGVEERTEPYHYIDVFITATFKDKEVVLKYGCPATLSENSKLGKLVKAVAGELEVGSKVNLEKTLIGKKVTFVTVNETTDRGTFARIADGSIKLAE